MTIGIKSYKRTLLAAILTGLFFLVLACGEPNQPPAESASVSESESPAQPLDTTPAHGDTVVEGSIGDASNLIPALASDSASSDIIELVYGALVKINGDLDLVGDLAESWDISDDGRVIIFHLRKNVRWHDGEPFTARDCMFTYRIMVDPDTPTAYSEQFKQIENAEIIDDYTFKVTYYRPFARALITWGMNIMPAHLLEDKDITTSDLARYPVGTGPYIFKEWETGQRIVLEANPDYFEGQPYISRVITRIIPDTATMFLELKSGGIDRMNLTPDQFQREAKAPGFMEQFNTFSYPNRSYAYLGFNLLDPKFRDRRVRQAIAYAINQEEIIKGVLLGLGQPANGPYLPGTWPYNPEVKPYPFNPEKAKTLLAEAGWKDENGDGILEKENQPFRFTIITNQGNNQRETTALIIQQRLKDVGIEVKVRTIEWAAFLKEFVDKKQFEALILSWTIPIDPDLYNVFHSSKTREGELNFMSYHNEEVDRLIDDGRFTLDREKRRKAYYRIQEILMEDLPYVFLYVPDELPAVASRIHGIKPAPAGITYNFTKWYVPKDLQKYHIEP